MLRLRSAALLSFPLGLYAHIYVLWETRWLYAALFWLALSLLRWARGPPHALGAAVVSAAHTAVGTGVYSRVT